MQIPPSGTYPQTARTPANTASRTAGQAPDGSAAPAAEAGAFTPTTDLATLLSAVRNTPEIRADVVQSAATRLAAGELTTPQAAGDTARALLDSAKTGE
ncbi:MAG: hypothetical protein JWO38_1670 [Gemmataceae bacterium]|nr:hypothetical protein [Gemmataceae bacterium]